MQVQKNAKTRHRKPKVVRIVKWMLAIAGVLLVLILLVVPSVVSSERFRRMVLNKINNSVEGRADFADLSMGWLKGVRIDDVSFNDNAGQVSVKVKQIATKPHYASIIAGNMSFGQTTIDEPRVEIRLKDKPPAGSVTSPKPQPVPVEAAGIALVTDVVIIDGSVKVTDAQSRTAQLSKINSEIGLRLPGEESTFDIDMVVVAKAEESKIRASARIKPAKTKKKTGWTLKGATGDLTIEIDDLDLESLEPFLALAGAEVKAKGRLTVNLKSDVKDGQIENLTGKVRGSRIDIAAAALKGDRLQTGVLDADIKLTRKDQMISIDKLQMKTDWADLNATGTVPTTLKSLDSLLDPDSNSNLKGAFSCDVAALAAQMPKTLGLKEGTKITSGRISGEVQTSGSGGRKQIKADADLADLKGTVGGKDVVLSQPVRANALISREVISRDKSVMKFDELNVSASFAQINCKGTIEELKYHADIDLAKLQSELGQFVDIGKYQMAGQFSGDGEVAVTEDMISAAGLSQIRDLELTSPEKLRASEPMADLNFAFNVYKKQNIIDINGVNLTAGFGRIRINNGVVPLNEKAKEPTKIVVNADNVDLAKLRPFAIMFASFPEEKMLAGILESEVTVTSADNAYRIVTEKTNIKNLEFSSPGKKPFKQQNVALFADILLDPNEQTYSIKKLNLKSEQLNIRFAPASMATKDGKTTLQGKADLEYDWTAIGSAASGFLPEGLSLQGKKSISVNFASQFPADKTDKFLANLTTNKCTLGFDRALYRGLDFGPTDVNAQFDHGVLRIDPFSSTVSNGQITFAADADFTHDFPIFQIPQPIAIQGVQINENLSLEFAGLLAYLNPLFAKGIGIGGVVNFSAEKLVVPLDPNSRNDIDIAGTIGMDNAQLKSSGLLAQMFSLIGLNERTAKIHPTNFTVQNGFVRYDNMQVDIGSTPVNFKGAIGLDRSLDMKVGLPAGSLLEKLKLGGAGGGSAIWVPLTGTIDKPELDTAKLFEGQLQDTIKGLLDGLLK